MTVLLLPERAPSGKSYYIATAVDADHKATKFLHSLQRSEKPENGSVEISVKLSPTLMLAKRFDRLSIARAYADLLNRQVALSQDFCVVLRHD